MRASLRAIQAALAFALLTAAPGAARAAADDFYHGRTVDLYIGFGVGGTYDLYARAVARHLGDFIPGKPTVVPISMPGAGGMVVANYIYKVAPHDGTALAITAQTAALDQLFGVSGIAYDVLRFNWLGRVASAPTIYFTWHQSPTKTFADARQRVTTIGASGSGDTVDPIRALDALAGAKFKLVLGYQGSNDVALAVERGEIEGGYALWPDLKGRKADWLKGKLVNLLFLIADRRDQDYPDVPLASELPPNPDGQKIVGLFTAPAGIGRSFFTAPGVPDGRVAMLRQAFDAMFKDADFLADAQKVGLAVAPMNGAELQAQVRALMQTPPDLVAKAEEARRP